MATTESGLVQKNPQNQTNGHFVHNYSSFPTSLSHSRAYTARFGEYTPSFVFDGVEKDEISVNSVDRLDSMSLNSPFKGTIRKIKESFCVPKMALLPLNWDRIYVQPVQGSDTPDDANCVLLNFPLIYSTFWKGLYDSCKNAAAPTNLDEFAKWLTAIMRMLVVGEYVYSEGSLLAYCGYHGNAQIQFNKPDPSYDAFFDAAITSIFNNIQFFSVHYGNESAETDKVRMYRGLSGALPSGQPYEYMNTFRTFLSDFRECPSAFISVADDNLDFANIFNTFTANIFNQYSFSFVLPESNPDDDLKDLQPSSLNLSRVLAYQMVCAHFYSNSGIDFIYTAELYRQYVGSLIKNVINLDSFVYNGVSCLYDFLSGHYIRSASFGQGDSAFLFNYNQLSGPVWTFRSSLLRLDVLASIFSFRRSLRFVDYFVGSRTRPLAPFNSDVAVNNNAVSVIDITKRIQGQRFANSVMRTRAKIENYVKGLFGNAPAPDYHNPFFLAREEETIFGDEVQNTAENLDTSRPNSRSALMASNSGRYTFTFHNDDNHPCIYMQIISFDIRRHYTRSVDRQMFQVNRYDMFNPDFQYIGDQPVYGMELGFSTPAHVIKNVFGYQGRDMEYKQSFDVALGGVIRRLPGWFFTDQNLGKVADNPVINSDFIRSYPAELDQFYLSLTGYSLATYFHFVINTINSVAAKRAMAVDPQILA